MILGEEYIHYEGYERQVKYRTKEEVDKWNKEENERQIRDINTKLAELDLIVHRDYENTYASFEVLRTQGIITTNPLYWDEKKQETVDKKNILRQQLRDLQL